MNVYICLPNDGEFEFDADVKCWGGSPGKFSGPPEDCYEDEDAEAEFQNYGPFYDMVDAVLTACWMFNCPMTMKEIEDLAAKVEEETISKALDGEGYEPDEPDFREYEKYPF